MTSIQSWDLIKKQDKIREIYYSAHKYLGFNFQQYSRNKYSIDNKEIYHDQRILLLLYSLEWFNINEKNYKMKIENHPLLLNNDYLRYKEYRNKYKRMQIYLSGFLSWVGLIFSFSYFKGNFKKLTMYSLLIFSISYSCLDLISSKKINSFIKDDNKLNQYLKLDLDINLIKMELKDKGINIEI